MLADHCPDLGTDFDAITRSANYNVVVGRAPARSRTASPGSVTTTPAARPAAKVDATVESVPQRPAGRDPGQIVDTLRELRDAGMTYALTYFADAAYDTSAIELFQREVIPALA